MPRLNWDENTERFYEAGVSMGVLYDYDNDVYSLGVNWNGLINVNENPEGGDANELWADNMKYGTIRSAEKYGFTIEAYQSPEEFDKCDGTLELAKGVGITQQGRKKFGFCYRTEIGNDESSDIEKGYKLHLCYGCSASPSQKDHGTINDSPDAVTNSWDVECDPVKVAGFKPTAHLIVSSLTADATKLAALEDMLYGTDPAEGESGTGTVASLPLPNVVKSMMTVTVGP